MLIHIFEDTPHHYLPMRRFFTNKCTIEQPQEFWVRSGKHKAKLSSPNYADLTEHNFVEYINADDLVKKLSKKRKECTFIFHGLNDVNIYWRLLFSSIVGRSSCVFWGYELYRYNKLKLPLKLLITKWLHCLILKKFNKVVALTPGDAQLVTAQLKRQNTTVLPYPGIGLTDLILSSKRDLNAQKVKIMVGNSAASTNEHIDAFESLKHLKEQNIEIIVPLNYAGEQTYIDKVISHGKKHFGEKFTPITNMLSKDEYDDLLNQVDITIFSHHRQQGLYVVYAMLLMGKPIYLRKETTSYENLMSLGFSIHAFDNLHSTSITEIKKQAKVMNTSNQALMNDHFTEQALAPKWSKMLNDITSVSSC